MESGLLIKSSRNAKPRRLTWEEFAEETAEGKIGPNYYACHKFGTENRWMLVTNLKVFHQSIRAKYPLGKCLKGKQSPPKIKLSPEQVKLKKVYNKLLKPLNVKTILSRPNAMAIACLEYHPSFYPPAGYYLTYGQDCITLHALWLEGEGSDKIKKVIIEIPENQVPLILRDWKRVFKITGLDGGRTSGLDGIYYKHTVFTKTKS